MKEDMPNGFVMGNFVLMGCHHRCQDQNKRDLADLSYLNVKRQKRKAQPASVAVNGDTKGDQHKQQHGIEDHKEGTVL